MGDEVNITAMEVIYDGVFQIDLKNETTNETYRTFCDVSTVLRILGEHLTAKNKTFLKENFDYNPEEDIVEEPNQ